MEGSFKDKERENACQQAAIDANQKILQSCTTKKGTLSEKTLVGMLWGGKQVTDSKAFGDFAAIGVGVALEKGIGMDGGLGGQTGKAIMSLFKKKKVCQVKLTGTCQTSKLETQKREICT